MSKSRADLVRVAHAMAASIFVGKKKITNALVVNARNKAFKAIQIADPLSGTAGHPHAAYAHGIAELANEGVEEARESWSRIQKHGMFGARTPAQIDREIAAYCKAHPIKRTETEERIHPEVWQSPLHGGWTVKS